MYSASNNEIEKYGRIESLSRFESDGARAINGQMEIATKLKKGNPKIIFIYCHNHKLVLAICPFFKKKFISYK